MQNIAPNHRYLMRLKSNTLSGVFDSQRAEHACPVTSDENRRLKKCHFINISVTHQGTGQSRSPFNQYRKNVQFAQMA
jgi:hypothetical protein